MNNPFLEAKKLLEANPTKTLGICGRITSAAFNGLISSQEKQQAKEIINRLLEGHMWLDEWIAQKTGKSARTIRRSKKKLLQTRLNWCDHLAELWEAGVRK